MGRQWDGWDTEKERFVETVHDELQYCGRIDDTEADAPLFIMPGSFVRMAFTGSSYVKAVICDRRFDTDAAWVGILLDQEQKKARIERNGEPVVLTLAEGLDKRTEHLATLFKRMDHCHEFKFLGFLLEYGARVVKAEALPRRRIEFYGDGTTAGTASEAVDFCGRPDPPHFAEFSNAYFSYAWITARLLHAGAHLIAQSGIALLDGSGTFEERGGMESRFGRVCFRSKEEERGEWNAGGYQPHVVVAAVGHNDSLPRDLMAEDEQSAAAESWREHYEAWIGKLRGRYPEAWIILSTTIRNHHPGWDRSIGKVCARLDDRKIVHFLYKKNGRGTPGHVRLPEAMEMALQLSRFINGLDDNVWD